MYEVRLKGDASGLAQLRAVREAIRALGNEDATMRDADEAAGSGLVGTSESYETAAHVAEALKANGVEAVAQRAVPASDPERWAQTKADKRAGATPEQVFARDIPILSIAQPPPSESEPSEVAVYSTQAYETALACLAHAGGDPLKACAWMHTLGRTADDADLYAEAALAVVGVFPWITEALRKSGLYPALDA